MVNNAQARDVVFSYLRRWSAAELVAAAAKNSGWPFASHKRQGAVVSVNFNKKKSMALDPALPSLRALSRQGLFQNISFVPPYSLREICNGRMTWQCHLRRRFKLTRQVPRRPEKSKGGGWRRKHDAVGFRWAGCPSELAGTRREK